MSGRRGLSWVFTALLAASAMPSRASAEAPAEAKPTVVRIDGPIAGLKLGLLHYPARSRSDAPIVLALHGQLLPHEANMGFPIGGRSLLGSLAAAGLDVWALDYYGFGASDPYPEMSAPAAAHASLGSNADVVRQVSAAIEFIRSRHPGRSIALFGDSRGTEIAGAYAAEHPRAISKLVLYGPVTPFTDGTPPAKIEAYSTWDPKDLWAVFSAWADRNPGPGTLDQNLYSGWAASWLASSHQSSRTTPPTIKVPTGGTAELALLGAGQFVFDPGRITVPTLLVMGETDDIAQFGGAQWLLAHLRNAPHRRLVVLGNGSHTMQFERERGELYRALEEFLLEPD